MAILTTALVLGWGSVALASSSASTADLSTSKGVLLGVDQKENTVRIKTFWGTRKFNLANDCKVSLQDKANASLTDLHPGQKVEIGYASVDGVKVARRITQHDVVFTGVVQSINPAKRKLTVRENLLDKTFWIADDCKVVLHDDKSGDLEDIQPGHRVTVTYETPDSAKIAREIAQKSATFTGELTAIDLNDRTLKAKAFLNSKKFNLADNCQILVGDQPDAKLRDLQLGEKLVISYDDQDGVNIVNRIATSGSSTETTAKTAASRSDNSAGSMVPVD